MPSISTLYFRTAIVLLVAGIGIGIHMSIQGDHSPLGAHAHLNLLGWVTSSLFAIYYALHPAKAGGRLPKVSWVVTSLRRSSGMLAVSARMCSSRASSWVV